jgi:hypothetical protein
MVRRELAALARLAKAPAAGGEDDRAGVDDVLAAPRAPARLDLLERAQRRLGEGRDVRALDALAKRGS